MKIIDTHHQTPMDLSVERDSFDVYFWSADKANFRPEHMPQRRRNRYEEPLHVVNFEEKVTLKVARERLVLRNLEFAEVVEGFYVGAMGSELVRKHQSLYLLGTIGSPNKKDFFCPRLLMFKGIVSYGIERLFVDVQCNLLIPEGTLVLARERR